MPKRQEKVKRTLDSVFLLRGCETWEQVLENPRLSSQALGSYNSVKQVWQDIQNQRKIPPMIDGLKDQVSAGETSIKEYQPRQLGSKGTIRDN